MREVFSAKQLVLALGISSLFSIQAKALDSATVQKWLSEVPGLEELIDESRRCPEFFEHLPDLGPELMFQEGLKLLEKKSTACESARHFFEVYRQYPDSPLYHQAQVKLIEALKFAGDYNGAINEANLYLERNVGGANVESVHYLMVLAVFEQFPRTGKTSQEWVSYALGINRDQNDKRPFIKNLAFEEYLRLYPDSPRRADVESKLNEARDLMSEHFIEIGHFYLKRRQYRAAIQRYGFVSRFGNQTKHFEMALYYLQDSYQKLADDLKSKRISDQQLRDMMLITGQPEPELRSQVIAQAQDQAEQIRSEMRKNRPESPWTRRLEVGAQPGR